MPRSRLILAAASLVFATVTVLSLASVATQLDRPWPGFAVWSNLVAPAIGSDDWPGIRAGIPLRSVLVAADGQPLRDAAQLRALVAERPPGTAIAYTFAHDGQRRTVDVPTGVLRWRDALPAYAGYLLAGLAFFSTALIVFHFRPNLPAARASLALGAALGGAMVLALDLFSAFWLERLYFVAESMMPAALLHFALCFPEGKEIVRRIPALRWLVYLPFVPLAIAQNVALRTDPALHLRLNDWAYTATACAGLVAFASLLHSFVAARSPLARQQAKVVLAGVTAAAFLPSLGLLAITVFGLQVPMNLLAPFFLFYPLSIAYAIARHDLFNVDRFLRLGVAYGVLSALVVLSYGMLVLGVDALTGGDRQLPTGLVPLYLFAVVVLFHPLQLRVQGVVDRLFSRQAYSYRGTVEAASRVLATAHNSEAIADTVLTTLTGVMQVEWAALGLRQAGGAPRVFAAPREQVGTAAAVLADDALLERLATGPRLFAGADGLLSPSGSVDPGLSRVGDAAPALVLPLRFRDQPLGVVLLGAKRSGAYYSGDDLDLLETLLRQAALALSNARAYELSGETQAELVRAERFAAVGELASAVAHGIRNPLAGIRGVAQMAREDAPDDSRLARDLDMVMAEADRLEKRVRTILDLSRPQAMQVASANLSRFLVALAEAARHRLPPGVRLDLDVPAALPHSRFDAARLDEVLETVILNAVEAMGGHGTIRLAARVAPAAAAREQVEITIADTGPGIPANAVERVFDLFYTTKSSGTGVGLAMARRLIEHQGGTITAASPPGSGAVFTIRLGVA